MLTRAAALFGAVILAGPLAAQPPGVPADAKSHLDVAYGPHDQNKLDVYVPKSAKPLPLVIWVHGGGWESGDKDDGGPAVKLLTKGYATASVNYRFSKAAPFPAQIADVRAAVRHLRANAKTYNVDPNRFAAWGADAGGHLVALLGTGEKVKLFDGDSTVKSSDPSPKVRAVVDWFGPTDLPGLIPPGARADNAVSRLFGGPGNMTLAGQANPVTHVSKDSAPFLICHGDADPVVPLAHSRELAAALKSAKVDCELIVLNGAGHGGKAFPTNPNLAAVEAFLDKQLKAK
jgi:acetyl esterase/lipase